MSLSDINLQNIFITKEDNLKLGDFGLASNLKPCHSRAPTPGRMGTVVYSAPEQLFGADPGARYESDIWGLGCVLHEMCTLKPTVSY